MLELKHICFGAEGKEILHDVNLKLEDGKFVVVTGPNGGGKSTLAKLSQGLKNPHPVKFSSMVRRSRNGALQNGQEQASVLLFSSRYGLRA